MIQPVKHLRIDALRVQGFKGFAEEHSFTFGPMSTIIGSNGEGKSSIADAIAFAITGVPFFGGSKLDQLYHGKARELAVSLTFSDETGTQRQLCRKRVRDTMEITLDGLRVTQRDLTLMFGERDLFLSMFNPGYFIHVLGSKGRDLLIRYLPDVPHEQVLAQLNGPDRALIEGHSFLSAEAFAKQLRTELAQLERDAIYLQGQRDLAAAQAETAAEQREQARQRHTALTRRRRELEALRDTGFDGSDLKERLADLYARYSELQQEPPAEPENLEELAGQTGETLQELERRRVECFQSQFTQAMSDTQAELEALRREALRQKRLAAGLRPGLQCPVCRQTVTEATLPELKAKLEASLQALAGQGQEKIVQLQNLQELDGKARAVFQQFQQEDASALQAKLDQLREQQQAALTAAKEAEEHRRQELERLHSEIQNTELDLEHGMLSPEQADELYQIQAELTTLTARLDLLEEQDRTEAAGTSPEDQLAQIETERKEKKRLLAAVGGYISKRVNLSLSMLHMNRTAIALFEVVKSTGEVKDTFRFTYEDRPYVCLSGAEQIKAGLEVAELVKGLLGVDYPIFIDDIERVAVIDNVRPSGQIFLARMIKGAPLTVQAQPATAPAQAA